MDEKVNDRQTTVKPSPRLRKAWARPKMRPHYREPHACTCTLSTCMHILYIVQARGTKFVIHNKIKAGFATGFWNSAQLLASKFF